MGNVQILHGLNAAQALDLAGNAFKTGSFHHALPGILVIPGHIVVGVVTGHHHQRAQDHLGVTGGLQSLDHSLAAGFLGLALHGADKHIAVTQLVHLGLHLRIAHLGRVGGAVAHQHKGRAVIGGSLQRIIIRRFHSGGHHSLGHSLFVGVDHGGIAAHFAQQRLGNGNGFKLVGVAVYGLGHFVILSAVHQVRGLHHQMLYAVCHSAVQSLLHIVDAFIVAGLHMVDDDLCGEGAAHAVVRVGGLQSILDGLDILHTAVVEGGAEAHHQNFVFADLILIAGIVQRGIAGVTAKVIGVGLVAFHQCLLGIGQGVPCGLGLGALGIGVFVAGLHINGIDQFGHMIGRSLIGIHAFGGRNSRSRGSRAGSGGGAAANQQAGSHGGAENSSSEFFHVFLLFGSTSLPCLDGGALPRFGRQSITAPQKRPGGKAAGFLACGSMRLARLPGKLQWHHGQNAPRLQ